MKEIRLSKNGCFNTIEPCCEVKKKPAEIKVKTNIKVKANCIKCSKNSVKVKGY